MPPVEHDLSDDQSALDRIAGQAGEAVARFDGFAGADVTLLNVSENATFLVEAGPARRAVFRVHRLGYHDRQAIESELAWVEAVRRDGGVDTPAVIRGSDGQLVAPVGRRAGGEPRWGVLFEHVAGHEPRALDPISCYRLGALTARLHGHAR